MGYRTQDNYDEAEHEVHELKRAWGRAVRGPGNLQTRFTSPEGWRHDSIRRPRGRP